MYFSKAVVRLRVPILVIAVALMILSVIGIAKTRVNFDMLTYLPKDLETVIGQEKLREDFDKGAFSFLIFEGMPEREISKLKEEIEKIEHVDTVLWYDSLFDISVPMEILPDSVKNEFKNENSTLMAIFFNTGTSEIETMAAVEQIRSKCGEKCFVSGMTALVIDLKELCEKEEPVYVGLAVILACVAMLILLDNFLIPFVFLSSIGIMIVINLGTNYIFGEISYITKALSAVLQLAVTMDYSIFLWHSYNEQQEIYKNNKDAMAAAISMTLSSAAGSSVTTIAGFIALCFMSFTLGKDLGLVMAKGVLLGLVGSVTVLPSIILLFDKILKKTRHRAILPDMSSLAGKIIKAFPVFLAVFVVISVPAYYGYSNAKEEVYYDMGLSLPDKMNYVLSNSKLREDFNIASTHMVLVDSKTDIKHVKKMIGEMEQVDGVKYVLGAESLIGARLPEEFIPDDIGKIMKSDRYRLIIINSLYRVSSDEVNSQLERLTGILKKYDENGMIIGEAPCMKDMIETTAHDFKVVNIISIVAIFIIIMIVEKSISLPLILIAVIEVGIFFNIGLPHYLGNSMSFITPICISTIQLGSTIDYAILMTTRYKSERIKGFDKSKAVKTALYTSAPSIIVSGSGLFAATFGVALYSDIEIISSMCMLLARGALVSMVLVITILPAMFMLFDGIIQKTTIGMSGLKKVQLT